jgi:hypothetical protein
MQGYLHEAYAQSLAEFGTPRELPRSRGWLLEREIEGFPYRDAMGCYPLFVCQDWSQLCVDLEDIKNDLVCVTLVTDPFGHYDINDLQKCFDIARPFKQHFMVDLSHPLDSFITKHHRLAAQRALSRVNVERCQNAKLVIEDWLNLYSKIVERHDISGISAFSKKAFVKQFSVPGLEVFRAVYKGAAVGMSLWFVHGKTAYYHLNASSPLGYKIEASFALIQCAIEYFTAGGLRWLNLGAGAGSKSNDMDGLTFFKQGWSNGLSTAYFCGKIFNHGRYLEIINEKKTPPTDYFPAYRWGEFR